MEADCTYLLNIKAVVVKAHSEMLIQECFVIARQSRDKVIAVDHPEVFRNRILQMGFHELC